MKEIATLKGLKCPQCGSENLRVTGKKGSGGKAAAAVLAGGAAANMIASRNASRGDDLGAAEPLAYICQDCRHKFQSRPLAALAEDLLESPCTIRFTRLGSMVGAIVAQVVYLNGVNCGAVKNGKSIELSTSNRWNTIFVTDQYGVAFPDVYRFEAAPGGRVEVNFRRKFIR